MMLLLMLIFPGLLYAELKAISYGQIESGQTLVELQTPSSTNRPSSNDTEKVDRVSSRPLIEDLISNDQKLPLEADSETRETEEDNHGDYGQHVPTSRAEETTLFRLAAFLPKRQEERAPAFQGYMQIDCWAAPGVCQNACWYQNCVMAGQGDVIYTEGRGRGPNGDKSDDRINRVQSGVATTNGRACSTWPFGQKFWDPYPNPLQRNLQVDEWPMASFQNPAFDPHASRPQHSLRCITDSGNSRGGSAWTKFREGEGRYGPKGDLQRYRTGLGPGQPLIPGDTFRVEFNFKSFDPNNETHNDVRK
jgi:hypothetical protein